jgi:hypothetical protein
MQSYCKILFIWGLGFLMALCLLAHQVVLLYLSPVEIHYSCPVMVIH